MAAGWKKRAHIHVHRGNVTKREDQRLSGQRHIHHEWKGTGLNRGEEPLRKVRVHRWNGCGARGAAGAAGLQSAKVSSISILLSTHHCFLSSCDRSDMGPRLRAPPFTEPAN